MAKFSNAISQEHQAFIEHQHIFFVSSAPLSANGHINLSPKGLDCFKVLVLLKFLWSTFKKVVAVKY